MRWSKSVQAWKSPAQRPLGLFDRLTPEKMEKLCRLALKAIDEVDGHVFPLFL